jgi:excisionase family DNA binding protein
VPGELLSTGEAAQLLGVHRSTILRYIEEGKLPAQVLPGGQHRVRREDVEKLLRSREES